MNQPENQKSAGSSNGLLIGIAVGVILIFLLGVVGGPVVLRALSDVSSLKQNYAQVSAQLDELKKLGPGERGRVALVDTQKVFKEYKGFAGAAQKFTEERDNKKKELEQLEKDYNAGKLSSNDFQQRQAQLVNDLQQLDIQLAAPIQKKMIEVIRQIGAQKGYVMVINNQEGNLTVLYSKSSDVDDITDQVLNKMNEEP